MEVKSISEGLSLREATLNSKNFARRDTAYIMNTHWFVYGRKSKVIVYSDTGVENIRL